MRAFASALSYFTIAPMRAESRVAPMAAVFAYLPLVGVLVGACAGIAAYGLALIGVRPLAVAAAFALPIVFTGGLHVDGFLDSCDALFACVEPQRRLEIMKDPHHGTFAVAYFAVLCAFAIAALASLPVVKLPLVVAYACGTGRWAAILNAWRFPYAHGGRPAAFGLVLGAVVLFALGALIGPAFAVAVPAVALLSLGSGAWAARRLGGVLVGDVYGALIVAGEVATLTVCAVLAAR